MEVRLRSIRKSRSIQKRSMEVGGVHTTHKQKNIRVIEEIMSRNASCKWGWRIPYSPLMACPDFPILILIHNNLGACVFYTFKIPKARLVSRKLYELTYKALFYYLTHHQGSIFFICCIPLFSSRILSTTKFEFPSKFSYHPFPHAMDGCALPRPRISSPVQSSHPSRHLRTIDSLYFI